MRIALALLLAAAASLQAQDSTRRALKPDDFARIKNVSDPQISPDGEWIAYTVSTIDLTKDKSDTDVWMVSWDGRTNLRITSTPDGEISPRWSPDGKYLSFTSSRQEGKGGQVWLLDRRGGEAQRLTEVRGGVSSYAWSPDASRLVFVVTDQRDTANADKPKPIVIDRYRFKSDGDGYLERKRTHIYLFDVAKKQLDTLTTGDYDDAQPVWSPDGKLIAFVSKREGNDPDRSNNSDIYVVEARKGATPRRLTTSPNDDSGPLVWTPDGKSLLYMQGHEAKYNAYSQDVFAQIPVSGGEPRLLGKALDRDVGSPRFNADGSVLYFTITDNLRRYLASMTVADEKVEKLALGDRVIGNFTMSNSGRIATTLTSPTQPNEIHVFDNGDFRKVTGHNDEFLKQVHLVAAEGVSWKTKDGNEVFSMLYRPLGKATATHLPTLFRIHGGPNSQNAFEFDFERQLFAANGYAVLSPNYRGSNGRGHAWKKAIFADWGNKEVVDILAGADWAVKSGLADPAKLGIGGWSYGCILTNYSIATDPNRFKAATCGAGSAMQISMYGSDQYIVQYENEIGRPWENPDKWVKISWPFFKANRIKTPTQYLGGQNDFNVPIIGGEQMYQALKSLDVPTEMIVYPGEKHGISRPSFVKDRYERYLSWYARYLGDAKPPVS